MKKSVKTAAAVLTAAALSIGLFAFRERRGGEISANAEAESAGVEYGADDRIYAGAEEFVTANGIMEGGENGDMRYGDTITRAEFVKMLMIAADGGGDRKKPAEFEDVPVSHWAHDYIAGAAATDFVDGIDETHFCPEERVSCAQAVKIVLKACGIGDELYPYGYISAALDSGILTGIELRLDEPITRGDAARLMYNAREAVRLELLSFERANGGYGLFESEPSVFEADSFGYSGGGGSAAVSGSSARSNLPTSAREAAEAPLPAAAESADGAAGYYAAPYGSYFSGEDYAASEPNAFRSTRLSPLSTFSIDTDTASYSNMRRFISLGQKPKEGSVRTEELINYFEYGAPELAADAPFGVGAVITDCPWSENKLARITVAGGAARTDRPSNLVFLIDVSGSMRAYNKLPMLKRAMLMLADRLGERDTVSIVTYAGGASVVLDSAKGGSEDIRAAIESLAAGGGTNGADGLEAAYEQVEGGFVEGGNNRIILCSDGDFNIGPSSVAELKKLIDDKRRAGIYLTTAGFGMGNYKDDRMELLADCGNGSYYYIDSMSEAARVFSDKLTGTLYTVAEDVKLQVEFNPAVVSEYRLVGYENRALNAEDFKNDKVDAGELGADAKVTVLYELVTGGGDAEDGGGEYRYRTSEYKGADEAFDVKIRYKEPGGTESILKEFPVENTVSDADGDTRFASAAAMLGLKLNGVIDVGYDEIREQALSALRGGACDRDTAEKWELVRLAELLKYIDR